MRLTKSDGALYDDGCRTRGLSFFGEGNEGAQNQPSIQTYRGTYCQCKQLTTIERHFRRPWLSRYLQVLKSDSTGRAFLGTCANGTTQFPPALPAEANEDVLVVYGTPNDGTREIEAQILYELSQKATTNYDLDIFFMSSDRTLGWWRSKYRHDDRYLAICNVRGMGSRVKGVKGWGRRSLAFEPDAFFRGYVEMTDRSMVECRLSHVDELYAFGVTEDSAPTIAHLGSAVCISVIAMMIGVSGRADHSGTVKVLAAMAVIIGTKYWPSLILSIRTCALGVIGGVTGILVSKHKGEFLSFMQSIELPLLVTIPFFFDEEWSVLVIVIVVFVLPSYWEGIFRNRAGEGAFWRESLLHREFNVGDSVPSEDLCENGFRGQRAVFTLRQDLENSADGIDPRIPAYAMGYGAWDLLLWSVGATPGRNARRDTPFENNWYVFFKALASFLLLLETVFAMLASFFLTLGAGPVLFIGWSSFKEADSSSMYLSIPEKVAGLSSAYFAAAALCTGWTTSTGVALAAGAAGLLVWIAFGFVAFLLSSIAANLSYWLSLQRLSIGESARDKAGCVSRNVAFTGNWDGMSKCRKLVSATYPRKQGYSYYDGKMFPANCGWYYPACGRVHISVPRSPGVLDVETAQVTSFFIRRRGKDGTLVGGKTPTSSHSSEDSSKDKFPTYGATSSVV